MPPPKVLFLGANGHDTTRLRLGKEVRDIRRELEATGASDAFQVSAELAVRPTDLQRLLLLYEPDLIHFSAHGTNPAGDSLEPQTNSRGGASREFIASESSFDPKNEGSGGLLLEDDSGAAIAVRPEVLTTLLAIFDRDVPLRCVVLNACFTTAQAEAIAEYVDCVIGTTRAIDDAAAIAFAIAFYRAIAHGKSIGVAFELGRNEIGLQGLSRQDVLRLFHAPDVNPDNVFLKPTPYVRPSRTGPPPPSERAQFAPYWAHVLEPAQHFNGREHLREELGAWLESEVDATRIIAICAIGGTGKTALVERVLRNWSSMLVKAGKTLAGGVFIWSFYENDRLDDFLGQACRYFLGDEGEISGRSARLLGVLKNDRPHLLVLDGLETIQTDDGSGRTKGEIIDHAFRSLIRQVAAKQVGQTRMLVTSRFRLCDVASWEGDSVRTIDLEDLEPPAAREVLRAWGVQGDEDVLAALAERVGWHALSVRVMGAFLQNYAGGNGLDGLRLDLDVIAKEASDADQKALKLDKLLSHISEKLNTSEREVMTQISLFHRGIGVEMLEALMHDASDGLEHAESNQRRLNLILRRLIARGLAFGHGEGQQRVYTAHPFVRHHFKKLADAIAVNVHELFRRRLAPELEIRQSKPPTDKATLDRFEDLIQHTLLAGQIEEAFELYWHGTGGYKHLGPRLGDYRRARRIVESFSPDGSPERCALQLPVPRRILLLNDWGFLARNVGDLNIAQACTQESLALVRREMDTTSIAVALHNQARLDFLRGRLKIMVRDAEEALTLGKLANDAIETSDGHALVGFAAFMTGDVASARQNFDQATRIAAQPLRAVIGLWESKMYFDLGDRKKALEMSLPNLAYCEHKGYKGVMALLYSFIGRLVLPDAPSEAWRYLFKARALSTATDHIEGMIHEKDVTARIHLEEKRPDLAMAAALEGLQLAETHGYGVDIIDLQLTVARSSLANGAPAEALRHALMALNHSKDPDCGYAWGEADALHLLGLAHRDLGERDHARARFEQAAAIRTRIEHPGAEESRAQAGDVPVLEFVKDRLRDVRARFR